MDVDEPLEAFIQTEYLVLHCISPHQLANQMHASNDEKEHCILVQWFI